MFFSLCLAAALGSLGTPPLSGHQPIVSYKGEEVLDGDAVSTNWGPAFLEVELKGADHGDCSFRVDSYHPLLQVTPSVFKLATGQKQTLTLSYPGTVLAAKVRIVSTDEEGVDATRELVFFGYTFGLAGLEVELPRRDWALPFRASGLPRFVPREADLMQRSS